MVDLFWKLMLNIYLTWIVTILIYYTLVPAIIGKGRTLGKLLAGIGTVDLNTLDEVSPSKLILREFVGRVLIEYILIIPLFVDRKSTRLNSSHVRISYAVFCLKKKML